MSEKSYHQRNIEEIFNRAKKYYKTNIEVLRQKQEINIENY